MNNLNYDPTNAGSGFPVSGHGNFQAAEQGFVTRVFNWMFMGLMATAVVSYLVASNEMILRAVISNTWVMIVLCIGLFGLVINISANIMKMSPQAAALNFFIYSALNGVLLSTVFIVYTSSSFSDRKSF